MAGVSEWNSILNKMGSAFTGNKISLLRDGGSVFIRDVGIFGLAMVTNSVAARTLGDEAFGLWSSLSVILFLADTFLRTKVDAAMIYIIPRTGSKGAVNTLIAVQVITLITSIIATILFLIIAANSGIAAKLFTAVGDKGLVALVSLFPIQLIFFSIIYFYLAMHMTRAYNLFTFSMAAFQSILSIIFVLIFKNVAAMVWGFYAGIVITSIFAIIKLMPILDFDNFNLYLCIKNIKSLLKTAIPLYLANISSNIQLQLPLLFAYTLNGSIGVGTLSLALYLVRLMQKLVDPITVVLFPYISSVSHRQSLHAVSKIFRISLLTQFALLCFYVPVLPTIVNLLYGKTYSSVASLAIIMAPGMNFWCLSSILFSLFNGTGNARLASIVSMPGAAIQTSILVALYLMKTLDTIAIAIAFSVSMAAILIIAIICSSTILGLQPRSLIPGYSDLKFLLKKLIASKNASQ